MCSKRYIQVVKPSRQVTHADDFWTHERATYQGSKGGLHKDSTVLRFHIQV